MSNGPRRVATWRGEWRDMAAQGVNHHYTREERLRLADIDGIDYLPPNSAVFRRWLAKQPHRRAARCSAPLPPQACRSALLLPRASMRAGTQC